MGVRWSRMDSRPFFVLTVVMALLVTGCITLPNGGENEGQAEDITLVIEFEDFDPDSFPDQRVEWDPDGDGGWTRVTQERPDNALYVITGLKASDALDVLSAASKASGIDVQHHVESQGAFVDSIDGVVNGRNGHYWSYYIDGDYGLVAADAADLSDGDEVRWVYMGNPFG